MPAFIDITGHRYGRLTVLGMNGRDKRGYATWLCRCECGIEITAGSNALRRGNTQSCGCRKLERVQQMGKDNRKHAESLCATGQPSREYRAWVGLRERCRNLKNKDFAKYGGRGISVCERWNSYNNFLADMGRCPPGYSIDRINNDGPYSPDNCRWTTDSEQNKNRRPLKRDATGKYC